MTLTDQIRAVLRNADTPITVDLVMDALPTGTERGTVLALLSQRRKAGEFKSCMEGGRVCYAMAAGKPASSTAPAPPSAALPKTEPVIPRANNKPVDPAREPVVTKEVTSAPVDPTADAKEKRHFESVEHVIDVTQMRIFAVVLGDTAESVASTLELALTIGCDPELMLIMHRCHSELRSEQVRILTETMEPV